MHFDAYFRGVERIMDDYGGRPHWGKRHFQTAATLAPRYPDWDGLPGRARAGSTPTACSANDYVERVLGPLEEAAALAAVRRHLVDDASLGHQVERLEPLAQLARLRVAHVDAVADFRRSAAAPCTGVCTSPAPSIESSSRPSGRCGEGSR